MSSLDSNDGVTTVLGAAFLAGIAASTWTRDDVREMWSEDRRFEPSMSDDQRQQLLSDWRRARTLPALGAER